MFSSSPSSSSSSSSSSTSSSSSSFPTISCVYLPASRSPCDMSYDCDMDINMDMNMNMNMNMDMEAIIPQDWTHDHDRDWEWDWKPRMDMEMMQLHNHTITAANADATSVAVAGSESTPRQQFPISVQDHTSADDLASPVYHATGMPISRCRALSMTQALYAQRLHQRSHAQVDEIDDDTTEKNTQIIHISKKHQACTTLAAMCWEGVAPSQRPQHIPSPVAKPLQLRRTATIPVDTIIPAITAQAAPAPAPAPAASTTLSSSVSAAYHDLYHSDAHHMFPNLELDGNVSVDGFGTDGSSSAAAASSSVSDASVTTPSRSSQAPATCHLDFDVNDESDVEADDDVDADENRDVNSDSFDTDMSHHNPAWECSMSHPHSYASSARTSPLSQSHMQWTSSDLDLEQQSSDDAAAEDEDEDEDENPTTDSLWNEFVLEPAIHVTSDKMKDQKRPTPTTPHMMKSLPTLIHTHNYRPTSYTKCQQSVDQCQQTMATAVHVASGTSSDRGTGTGTGIMFPRLRSTTSFHHSPLARPICRTSSGMLPPLVFPSQLQHKVHHVQSTQWQAPTRPSTATATTAVIPPSTTILDMLRHRQDTLKHPHTLKHTQQEKEEVKVQDHSSIMIPSRPNTAVTGMGMGMRMGMGLGTSHTPTVYAQ